MQSHELLLSLGVAAASGFLIGLERERSAPPDRSRASFLGGSRTHPLFAIAGGLSALLSRQLGPGALLLSLGGLLAFLVASYVDDIRRGAERGLTSEAAFLVSFLLGALALSDGAVSPAPRRLFAVAATAVVVTLLLSAKPALHPLARRLSTEDLTATLKFLVVAVVVLPLLPDEPLGPLRVLNPRGVGLMAVFIAGMSFVGYAAIRLLGPGRALGIVGIVGGIASSMAVTLSLSPKARTTPRLAAPLALGVLLASTTMFVRVLVIVGVANPTLLAPLASPMLAMFLTGAAAGLVLYRRASADSGEASELRLSNPFELSQALGFALLLALVLLASRAAALYLGVGGTYATAALAGAADVDAISLSMARLAQGDVSPRVASTAIVIASASNTASKAVLAGALGGRAFAARLVPLLALVTAAGAVALWLA